MLQPMTTQIHGHTFTFTPETSGPYFTVRPTSPDHALFPVTAVLHSAWGRSPLKLLQAVQQRQSVPLEAANFSYEVDEETIEADFRASAVDGVDKRQATRCSVLGEATYVPVQLWHALIVEYGRYVLQTGHHEPAEALLLAAELEKLERQ